MSNVTAYLSLPYTKVLKRDEDGAIIATIPELSGCMADGATEAEALQNLLAVQAAWIEEAIESGLEIPLPTTEQELPSGKWVQRVPRSLHARLVKLAEFEETSLNQLVTAILSEAVSLRETWTSAPRSLTQGVHRVWEETRRTLWNWDVAGRISTQYAETLRRRSPDWSVEEPTEHGGKR